MKDISLEGLGGHDVADPSAGVGRGIMERMLVRERQRAQEQFLQAMSLLPISRYFTLCGSAALHGVYLQGRFVKDINFCVPVLMGERFPEIAAKAGLNVERTGRGLSLVYKAESAVFSEIVVAIEVVHQGNAAFMAKMQRYTTATNVEIPVVAPPVTSLLVSKLGCLFQRERATDYLDLWLGLRSDSAVTSHMKRLLEMPRSPSEYAPPRGFRAGEVAERMESVRSTWVQDVGAVVTSVPHFDEVREDLFRGLASREAGQ